MDGAAVSSSRIRGLIASGEMAEAVRLLGHPHLLSGTVVTGHQLGRTIGIPTANLDVSPQILLPMDGAVKPYSLENIKGMYQYLRKHGELYIIEYLENGEWNPIGDVTFWREDMPIVIGRKDLHGRGIGKRVVHSAEDV